MGEQVFAFKQFSVDHENAAFKVGTDACLLGCWVNISKVQSVLDIGTGSGVISLIIAQRCNAVIEAIDIDKSSALQAKRNFEKSPWKERLVSHNQSLQQYEDKNQSRFDLIICNPPFFRGSTPRSNLRSHVARHETDLTFMNLLDAAKKLTSENGRLAFVLPLNRWNENKELANTLGWFERRKLEIKPTESKKANRVLVELSQKPQKY
ncbi:MAG: methyltransferase [Salibacteraceae bacterium]